MIHPLPKDSLSQYATEGMLNFTWYLLNQGEWFLCGDLLSTAQKYCPPQNQALFHQIETAMAGIDLYTGNYKEAGKRFLDAYNYFNETKDTVELLKNCVNLGLYYSRTHNKNKALEYYGKVLAIAGKEKKYENYYSIVTGYAEKVEEDSVINLSTFEKALRISLDNGYTFLLASNYLDLARYYYRMENYHESLSNARKALDYAEKFSVTQKEIAACGIIADVYYIQKNYVAAYSMLSRKNTLIKKSQENRGKAYYTHLNQIDSLLNWVNANVPAPEGNKVTQQRDNSRNGIPIIWVIALCAVLLLVGLFIGVQVRARKKGPQVEISPVDPASNRNNENTIDSELKGDMMQQAVALSIIAESYNPMLDRIRNIVKEIPKSGDSTVDAQVRNLTNYLLQSRLPDRESDLGNAVKSEENRFVERLRKVYPDLTKNDLRIALYIRCGLNLREISSVSGLQSKSVNQARYRLRKSLGLAQDDSLEAFIATF